MCQAGQCHLQVAGLIEGFEESRVSGGNFQAVEGICMTKWFALTNKRSLADMFASVLRFSPEPRLAIIFTIDFRSSTAL